MQILRRTPGPPLLPWPIRGLAAGYVGVAAMSLTYYLQRRRRARQPAKGTAVGTSPTGASAMADGAQVSGLASPVGLDYDDSVVPGQIVASILPLPERIAGHPGELTIALRWGYGSMYGLTHVYLRHRVREPWASLGFGGALLIVTFTMFPLLGRTPPPWQWPIGVLRTALRTHTVYVLAVATTDELLR